MQNDLTELEDNLKTYLYQNLEVKIDYRICENQGNLPFYLTDSYEFLETYLFGRMCLLMIDKTKYDFPAVVVGRDIKTTETLLEGYIVIYVQSTISAYNRKRLIGLNVPFIIPGNQMYLPHFMDALIENFKKMKEKKVKND